MEGVCGGVGSGGCGVDSGGGGVEDDVEEENGGASNDVGLRSRGPVPCCSFTCEDFIATLVGACAFESIDSLVQASVNVEEKRK